MSFIDKTNGSRFIDWKNCTPSSIFVLNRKLPHKYSYYQKFYFSIHNRKVVEGTGPSRQRAVGRIEVKLASSSKKGGEASGMAQDISFRVKADPWRCHTLPEMVVPTERKQKRESRP